MQTIEVAKEFARIVSYAQPSHTRISLIDIIKESRDL